MEDTSAAPDGIGFSYAFTQETFLVEILEREGWRKALKGERPDFSMLCAMRPLPGRAPPMPRELKERAQQYRQLHPSPPPEPLAPIRMHAAPGVVALNDKSNFWLVLQGARLSHLSPHTILGEEFHPSGITATLNAVQDSPSKLWFFKERHSDNAKKVKCFTDPSTLEAYIKKYSLDKAPWIWLVQAGVLPLLRNDREPVLRVYVLVLGQHAYVHREFLLKTLSGEYSEDTDSRCTHVDCVAGDPGVSVMRGSEWTEYPQVFPKICEAAGLIMAAYKDVLEPDTNLEGCRYSLIGLDVIATPERDVKVLEANCPPALYDVHDDVARRVKMELQEDFYRFVVCSAGRDESMRGGFEPVGA